MVFSVYDPVTVDWETLETHYRTTELTEARPLLLVAGTQDQVRLPQDIQPYFADYKTLITMNRSNGGGTYFYYGELMHKWSVRQFPNDLAEDIAGDPDALSTRHVTRRRITAQGFCVVMLAILVLL